MFKQGKEHTEKQTHLRQGKPCLHFHTPLTNSTIKIYEFNTSLLDATFKYKKSKMFYNSYSILYFYL